MKAVLPVVAALATALLLGPSLSTAHAQTAFGSPLDLAPRGLPGVEPGVSRTPPSVGTPKGAFNGHARSRVALPKIVTESDQDFDREQRLVDEKMVICQGCN